ncbi:MAG: ribonuclease P protein component [Chlorobiaceae bacterium]|jgi:ribonuclease P protein component|nr:ribonuclease P protein component [Chlorobiaceae bacterium]
MFSEKRANVLPRRELMRGKTHISRLFNQGSRLKAGALLMIFADSRQNGIEDCFPMARVLFTVGKKLVPRAVDRNRIKRLMREAYRLEKGLLSSLIVDEAQKESLSFFMAFLYRGKVETIPSLEGFRAEIRRLLKNFVTKRVSPSQLGVE